MIFQNRLDILTIHAAIVDCGNSIPPSLNVTKMLVEKAQIQRTICVCPPRLVDERSSCDIDCFNAHPLNVVETVDESLKITAMTKLRLSISLLASDITEVLQRHSRQIVFEMCSVNVIVAWISVHELVEE